MSMMPTVAPWLIFLVSIFAGCIGAILGLGGGLILIPCLTLIFGIDIRFAVGASIVSVIATSSGAAATYVRDQVTNIRLAIFLEIATTLGALCGVTFSAYAHPKFLYLAFSGVMLQSAYFMWNQKERLKTPKASHPWATRLKLNSSFMDLHKGIKVSYNVAQVPQGFLFMYLAGLLSGLLGIGSGILKVLAMDRKMGIPIKASSATSNFMIGVTAAAGAGAYLNRGDIIPELAAPVALGVLVGSFGGARLMMRLPAKRIRQLFVGVLTTVAIQMAIRGFSL